MAVTLRLRGVDGKFVKGNTKNLEEAMIKFGSKVIQDGRVILNSKGKRTASDALYNDYQIEIPTMAPDNHSGFRISLQGYNSELDVEYFIQTLKKFL